MEIEEMKKTPVRPGCPDKACVTLCSNAPLVMTSPSGEPTNNSVPQQLGIFDIFKIGIGPSSSHTNGPMVAAFRFVNEVCELSLFDKTASVRCDLFGSLALTGVGHGTDKAVVVGLAGNEPAKVDPDEADRIFACAKEDKTLLLQGRKKIDFVYSKDMIFHFDAQMPQHPNGMRLAAMDKNGNEIYHNEYLSVGGGFVKTVAEFEKFNCGGSDSPASTRAGSEDDLSPTSSTPTSAASTASEPTTQKVPYPFRSAAELLRLCREHDLSVGELMMRNECEMTCNGNMEEVHRGLDRIWLVMSDCIDRGKKHDGLMPVTGAPRRAHTIYRQLKTEYHKSLADHFAIMDWITLFARAVNEENACGGRVVTAPTNGASGTLPAVLAYYQKFFHRSNSDGVREFLSTAAAFGVLLKTNASISGAEAGCQAEVGSACAMAAAGLTSVMGGNLAQIENAAEIALEHNLGMTCDPLGGLVQVPCIERNCVAAVKAITAHRLAMKANGGHAVSFDSCVETMYRTGLDMQAKYRETSTGGLALYARRPEHIEKGEKIRMRLKSLTVS